MSENDPHNTLSILRIASWEQQEPPNMAPMDTLDSGSCRPAEISGCRRESTAGGVMVGGVNCLPFSDSISS